MIAKRVENLLALDYPAELVDVVVASDASTDGTDRVVEELAAREPRVRLLACPRGGKVNAQNLAVRQTESEIVAFSDANATWAPDTLRRLVRNFADTDVAYVCGQLRLQRADGTNLEGTYWRYEVWLREQESRLGSVTAATAPSTRYGARTTSRSIRVSATTSRSLRHGPARPSRRVRAGGACLREALSRSRGRIPAQGADVRALLADAPPGGNAARRRSHLSAEIVSHRVLRYGSGIAHLPRGDEPRARAAQRCRRTLLAAQVAGLGLAAAGRLRAPLPGAGLAYYYSS